MKNVPKFNVKHLKAIVNAVFYGLQKPLVIFRSREMIRACDSGRRCSKNRYNYVKMPKKIRPLGQHSTFQNCIISVIEIISMKWHDYCKLFYDTHKHHRYLQAVIFSANYIFPFFPLPPTAQNQKLKIWNFFFTYH